MDRYPPFLRWRPSAIRPGVVDESPNEARILPGRERGPAPALIDDPTAERPTWALDAIPISVLRPLGFTSHSELKATVRAGLTSMAKIAARANRG